MSEHTLHYGDISWTMPVAGKNLAAVLESNPVSLPVMEPDQAVREALRHPVGSPCLKDIVNPGEKICLLVPDVTRLWQSPAVYVHVMVEELNACGIPDSDILIVTATGTHRAHRGDEQARLLGGDICRRIRVIDHVWCMWAIPAAARRCGSTVMPWPVTRSSSPVAWSITSWRASVAAARCCCPASPVTRPSSATTSRP